MKSFLEVALGPLTIPLAIAACFGLLFWFFTYADLPFEGVISVLIAVTPLWLPYVLFYLTFEEWRDYVKLKWTVKNGRSTLRIKLPPEVLKSPEAMESVIQNLHSGGAGENLMETYIDGIHTYPITLELVSIGGDVRFYINCPTKKVKNSVEALLYGHYPGIEVIEEQLDYTAEIPWDPERYNYLPFHMNKKEDQILPIKTYIDFGLDKLPKEEEKFEPMVPLIEQLARAKPQQRIWIQIIIRGHAKKNLLTGHLTESGTWVKAIDAKKAEMLLRDQKNRLPEGEVTPRLSKGEQDLIASMERQASKFAFETAIRVFFIAPKEHFDTDLVTPIMRAFNQFGMLSRNDLGVKWRANFDYNWFSDRSGKKRLSWKKKELRDHKLRKYSVRNYPSESDNWKVFSAEELATIFHIPGTAVISPGIARVSSTRKEAPSNLPTGQFYPS
jgi:hypothetical protein